MRHIWKEHIFHFCPPVTSNMACYGRHGGMRYVITLYPNPYLGCLNCGVVWYVLLLVHELQLTQKTRDIDATFVPYVSCLLGKNVLNSRHKKRRGLYVYVLGLLLKSSKILNQIHKYLLFRYIYEKWRWIWNKLHMFYKKWKYKRSRKR